MTLLASPVRGACSSRGMAWYSTTYTRPPALPDTHAHAAGRQTRVQQTLFRAGRCQRRQHRHPGVASASDSSMGALRHGDRWESGQRLELELACAAIPACATTAASQGPRRGSVPGERGSHWINAILVPLARTRVLWRR